VLAGEQPAVVAKQIKNRLAAAIGEAMGKEVAPAADVVQEDMFAAAARAVDEPQAPIELTPDERAMAEAQLLQEAIANGEVRPPNAPIPDLPEPAQVRLDDLALDEPLTPGGKLSQATADEVRLAIEHKQADAAMAWEQQQAARDAVAYEDLTFDQKKDAGLGGGIDDVGLDEMRYLREELAAGSYPPEILQDMARKLAALEKRYGQAITPEVLPPEMPRLSDQLRQNLNNLGQSIGEFSKTVDDVMQRQDASLAQRAEDLAARAEEVPISELPKISDVLQSTMRAMAESDARLYRGLGESLGNVKRGLGELADAPVRPEPLRLTAGAEQPEFTLPQELSKSAPRYGRYTVKFDSDLDRAAYVLANDAVKPSKAAPKFRAAIEAAGMDPAEVVAHGKRVKAALKKAAQGNLTGQVELPAQPFGDVAKPPTKAGADRVRQQIEVNNQTMDDIRRKAQQEGC
jgi:Sec-independent protein translocase protein TatA